MMESLASTVIILAVLTSFTIIHGVVNNSSHEDIIKVCSE